MEIYNLYYSIISIFCMSESGSNILKNNAKPFIVAIGVSVGLIAILFTLQAIGVYVMSKKRNLDKRWLCFVPFASTYQIGRLTGPCEVFGRKMKRAGLYAMIAQIANLLLSILFIASQYYLFVECGDALMIDQSSGRILSENLSKTGRVLNACYEVTGSLMSIFSLLESVLVFILIMGLFRKYSVKNYMVLSFVALLVPMARFVIIYILRNNAPINFEAYMRAKREAYVRRMQSYGNPYGAPNTPPYTPPTQNATPQEPFSEFNAAPQEPFAEFGGSGATGGPSKPAEPFAEFSSERVQEPKTERQPKQEFKDKPKSDDDLFE